MELHPVFAIRRAVAQVVEVRHREAGQTLILLVAEDLQLPAQDVA